MTVTAEDGKAKVEIDPEATEPGTTIGGKIYPITGEPDGAKPSLVIDEDGDVITDNGSVDLGKEPDGTDEIYIPQTGEPGKKLISVVPDPSTGVKKGPATVTTVQPDGTTTIVLPPEVSVEIDGVIYTGKGPEPGGKSPFSDVADDAWYADAVIWAAAEGVVDGHGDGTYAPEDNISREELAKIFYNYAQMKGLDVSGGQNVDLNSFADGDQVSAWAQDAVRWAVGNGLMRGKGKSVLDPVGSATRAEVAEMMMNFCLEILKK